MSEYDLPNLGAYIRRIGAERKNWRRYVIREQIRDLYHYDKYVISISQDGDVDVREGRGGKVPDEKKPTPEEQAAIKVEWTAATLPKSIAATDAKLADLRAKLRKAQGSEPILFVYRNARRSSDGDIPFVQQRIFRDNGDKADLPWSFWSDGEWRCMEPDGDLPLYGLDRLKDAPMVFIHEGAKTAKHSQMISDALDKHEATRGKEEKEAIANCPWAQDMKFAAHLGWPGGAPNPHRVNWEPIADLSPHVRVVQVCDNDPPGENAAPYISRTLKRRMWVVRFGDNFPRKFDLADAFPDGLFKVKKGQRVYSGPTLDQCTEPATWATSGKDRLRPEFIEEWHFTVKPAVFINRSNLQRRYDETEFNINIAPFSDVANVADLLRRVPSAKAETLIYEPGHPTGRIAFEGAQVINVYQPSPIALRKGDVAKFEEYLEYLIPDAEDRTHVKGWIATLIARPDLRMSYGLLLISHTQGVGKTTLAEKILVPLVGLANCSFPTPRMAIDSQFTSWLAFRRLAVIGEIYDGHTAKAYNQLKSVITDANVMVNEKYEKAFSITNYIHVIASSNSFRALKVDDQDRRWLIPGVTETLRDHAYWTDLNAWLQSDEALPAIAAWAVDYVRDNGPVAPGQHAPMSSAKRRTIEEGRSDGERMISELAQDIVDLGRDETDEAGNKVREAAKVVVRQDEIRVWLALCKANLNSFEYGSDGNRKLETAERIASLLRSSGLYLPTGKEAQFRANGERFRIAANFEIEPGVKWPDLRQWHLKPEVARAKAAGTKPL